MLNFFYGHVEQQLFEHYYLIKNDSEAMIVYLLEEDVKNERVKQNWYLYHHSFLNLKRVLTTTIYAFNSFEQLMFFQELLQIEGIGIVNALKIIRFKKEELKDYLINENDYLNKKEHFVLTNTILLKLKRYFLKSITINHDQYFLDTVQTLKNLGYKTAVINDVLNKNWHLWKEFDNEKLIKSFIKEAAYANH